MTPPLVCRGGRSCDQPATHADLVRRPDPLPAHEGWEPLCWAHAIESAVQVGSPTARYRVTLTSIAYAVEDDRPLVRYASQRGYELYGLVKA